MPEYEDLNIHDLAEKLIEKLKSFSLTLALAESCTGGMISGLLTGVPGASRVLWGSFVCYTQEAKVKMLGLDHDELSANGLVSEKTARAMALGALQKSGADIAAAVTGIAGPDGDGSGIPTGTVWAAVIYKGKPTVKEFHFTGGRNEVRRQAVDAILNLVLHLTRELE